MTKLIKAIVFIGMIFSMGCSDSYFADGGNIPENQSGVLGVSTMDYLKNNPVQFDTLATLIRMTNLETAVNAKGNTFFAPRDYSIFNYFQLIFPDPEKRPASLAEIPQEELDKIKVMLENYIVPNQEILRGNLASTYSYATTAGGRKSRFNVVKEDYLGNVNMGAQFVVFSLNMSPEGVREVYQSVQVTAADLRSTNGIVHILTSETHILGFN
ncbi:fasciclin domain-containing protein [Pedobacter sp. AW31-3R]|uniref:fasciclin domain-containing protein n=1 Tax=Pedobacter sp. AW31-3R TaxID=3445781 RepID=UPI003FA088E4